MIEEQHYRMRGYLNNMNVVRDPIHGYIELDELTLSLIDTPPMQRLRRIRQLGLSNLVYPGANHSRFEHSLGVMHLATMLTRQIDSVSQQEKDELRVAALLHDIGHGPLSHVSESFIIQYTRQKHEDILHLLRKGEIAEILEKHDLSPTSIQKHIKGETDLGKILSSEIDVDRMDYLVRDSYYTGVAFGLVDHVRLIHEMHFYEDKLVVASKSGALDSLRSDVGIVYSPGGRIAIAATVNGMREVDYSAENAGNKLIGRLAVILVDGLQRR